VVRANPTKLNIFYLQYEIQSKYKSKIK